MVSGLLLSHLGRLSRASPVICICALPGSNPSLPKDCSSVSRMWIFAYSPLDFSRSCQLPFTTRPPLQNCRRCPFSVLPKFAGSSLDGGGFKPFGPVVFQQSSLNAL